MGKKFNRDKLVARISRKSFLIQTSWKNLDISSSAIEILLVLHRKLEDEILALITDWGITHLGGNTVKTSICRGLDTCTTPKIYAFERNVCSYSQNSKNKKKRGRGGLKGERRKKKEGHKKERSILPRSSEKIARNNNNKKNFFLHRPPTTNLCLPPHLHTTDQQSIWIHQRCLLCASHHFPPNERPIHLLETEPTRTITNMNTQQNNRSEVRRRAREPTQGEPGGTRVTYTLHRHHPYTRLTIGYDVIVTWSERERRDPQQRHRTRRVWTRSAKRETITRKKREEIGEEIRNS